MEIIKQVYKNGDLVNTFTIEKNNIVEILELLFRKAFNIKVTNRKQKVKMKQDSNGTHCTITETFFVDMRYGVDKYDYVYTNIPMAYGTVDTTMLLLKVESF